MESTERPGKPRADSTAQLVRSMGMTLSIIGAIIVAAGLGVSFYDIKDDHQVRGILMLVLGVSVLLSGLYIWRSVRKES